MGAGGGGDGGGSKSAVSISSVMGRSAAMDRGGPRGGTATANIIGPSSSRGPETYGRSLRADIARDAAQRSLDALGRSVPTAKSARNPGARSAAETAPSRLASFMGLSDADRQANFNANAAAEAASMRGNRGGGGDYQAEVAAAAEAKGAAQPKSTTFVSTPAAAPEPSRPAPRSASRPAPAPQPAFDPAAYMADIQSRYDEQLQSIQKTIAAADEARAAQLAELTKQTDDRKKKLKAPRKYGRLSLLSGSELGIPTTMTLGG